MTNEPQAALEQVAKDLPLDLDGVQTLLSELRKAENLESLDAAYVWRVIHTVNASLARHMVTLNEFGKAVEDAS